MTNITIVRAKPNPAGRDAYQHRPLPQQLQGEWIDLQNTAGKALNLTGVFVHHRAFEQGCSNPKFALYWQAPAGTILPANAILRVHTGKSSDRHHMTSSDSTGANQHAWGEHGWFQLNNGACGDIITVWFHDTEWHRIDEVGYDPYPPEGAVLVRNGNKLANVAGVLAGVR